MKTKWYDCLWLCFPIVGILLWDLKTKEREEKYNKFILDKIDEWHKLNSKQKLHEYLDMTKEEYEEWVK